MKGRFLAAFRKGEIAMETSKRQLMWHGMFLFLLGLLTGFAEQHFTNVAQGARRAPGGCHERHLPCCVGRHLGRGETAVTGKGDGILDRAVRYLRELADSTLAAVFGTAANTPIAAAGYSGQPWQETLVAAGFLTTSLSIIAASVLVLWGLRARASQS
jgi:hydroxylaminobenzene mutase